ncbi:MAG: hypothetical protein NTY99_02015 [DPANN group archaeon]|nr:hypothetical protein [DPANN group archaeon]
MEKQVSSLESQILMEQKALDDLKWRGPDFDKDEAIYQINRNWGIGYSKFRNYNN